MSSISKQMQELAQVKFVLPKDIYKTRDAMIQEAREAKAKRAFLEPRPNPFVGIMFHILHQIRQIVMSHEDVIMIYFLHVYNMLQHMFVRANKLAELIMESGILEMLPSPYELISGYMRMGPMMHAQPVPETFILP